MSDPEVHIAEWQAAGLIDASLAQRLRESGQGAAARAAPPLGGDIANPRVAEAAVSPADVPDSFLGPSPTVGEVFAYLGTAFLLGAWVAYLGTLAADTNREAIMTGGLALAAAVMVGLGVLLARGDQRRRRGAGIAFFAATALAAGAAEYLVQLDFLRNTLQDQAPGVLVALVALVVAFALRRHLPAVTTQLALLAATTGLAAATLAWFQAAVVLPGAGNGPCCPPPAPTPVSFVLASAGWWLLIGLALGVIGLVEGRAELTDSRAARRAGVTRFWAGLVAVGGLASSLTQTGYVSSLDGYRRILEPWVADVAILVLAVVLVERAFRRDSNAFILSGAIGLIVASSDFNFSYMAQSTYVGLLIEGAILLLVGFGADRLRRRLDQG